VSRWIDRYLAGEHEAVWAEMRALGAGIVEQPDGRRRDYAARAREPPRHAVDDRPAVRRYRRCGGAHRA
jgi:hypothetical protein